jgi:hypothetical protein
MQERLQRKARIVERRPSTGYVIQAVCVESVQKHPCASKTASSASVSHSGHRLNGSQKSDIRVLASSCGKMHHDIGSDLEN